MAQTKNFKELCHIGIADPKDIDDYIDRWHNSNSKKELHEFLGLTKEEYKKWVEGDD